MNLYQIYITSNIGYVPKEAVRICTNAIMTGAEIKAMEDLKYREANALCKYRYNAQLLYSHVKE